MIYAKIIYGNEAGEVHQINHIWDYDGDGKQISGVDFWKLEGRTFEFECELDNTIRWLINRERTEPGTYRLNYGIRKAKCQVFRDDVLISEGYLTDDSFKPVDYGNMVSGEKIELVRIKFTDLFGCLVKVLEGKTISLTASNDMVMLDSLIHQIIARFGNEFTQENQYNPLIWLNWLQLQFQWQALPNYGYAYNRYMIKSINEIIDAYQYLGHNNYPTPSIINHKDYMTIVQGESYPLLTIVRHDIAWMSSYYVSYIHIVRYNIIGATAVKISDVGDFTSPYTNYNNGRNTLLNQYNQPNLTDWDTINAMQILETEFGLFEVVNNELLFTGQAYIDRIQIAQTGEYPASEVLAVCLNILYGWLDSSDHALILKNKLPWDWDQEAIEIVDSGIIEAESVVRESKYDPSCEWLSGRDEIVRVINDYYAQAVAGVMMNIKFSTCQDVGVGQYIRNRGYIGYVTGVNQVNILTTEKQIMAIGYYETGGSRDQEVIDVPTITINAGEGNVMLQWEEVTGATLYKIYGSANRDAVYPDGWTALDTTEDNYYIYPGEAKSLYFRVAAVIGELESDGSNLLGFIKHDLVMGDNYVPVPVGQQFGKVADLGNELLEFTDTINYWDNNTQEWSAVTYLEFLEMWDPDIDLVAGMILLISVSSATSVIFVGDLSIYSSAYNLLIGENYIIVPSSKFYLTMASELGDETISDTVKKWLSDTQEWLTISYLEFLEMWDPDFEINPGDVLGLNVVEENTWA